MLYLLVEVLFVFFDLLCCCLCGLFGLLLPYLRYCLLWWVLIVGLFDFNFLVYVLWAFGCLTVSFRILRWWFAGLVCWFGLLCVDCFDVLWFGDFYDGC